MKKLISFGILNSSLLLILGFREYQKEKQLFPFLHNLTNNNTLHVLHTLFLIYLIFVISKSLVWLTIGKIRSEEITTLNDNFYLFITDILLVITIFADDLSVKNSIIFCLLMSLKCINWILIERIKHFQLVIGTYTLILVLFTLSLLLSVTFLKSAFKRPGLSILFSFEFGLVTTAAIRHFFFCFTSYFVDDKRTIAVFIIDIIFTAAKLLQVILFFAFTTIYFRLPYNLIREALATARQLFKKVTCMVKYIRISKELNKCQDASGEGSCPICFSDMELGKKILCGHVFHLECLKKWVESNEVCPICRRELFRSDEIIFHSGNERITAIPIVYED